MKDSIPNGWTRAHLGDLFTERKENGVDGLPTMSVTMHDGLVIRNGLDRRMETTLDASSHLLVKQGDIAYNMMRMWQGACGLADSDCIVSPAYVVLTPKPSIDPRYFVSWFKSARGLHSLWAYSHGLTDDRRRLYFDDFCQIPIDLPPLDEQSRIAEALAVWDRAVATAEAHVTSKRRRLLAALTKVFGPERNPLRTVGTPLSDQVNIRYGKGLADTTYDAKGKAWVCGSQGIVAYCDVGLAVGPAVIVGRKGTLTSPLYVPDGQSFWPIDTTFYLQGRLNARLLQSFLSYVNLARLNAASGVPSISADALAAVQIPSVLGGDISAPVSNMIAMFEDDIAADNRHVKFLRTQKRSLMQKLLTGERRLSAKTSEAAA